MDPNIRARMKQLVEDRENYREPDRIRGVGDVIAKATKAIGIQPCGKCEQRRQWLNKKFPVK
jgi:hypothetical protein